MYITALQMFKPGFSCKYTETDFFGLIGNAGVVLWLVLSRLGKSKFEHSPLTGNISGVCLTIFVLSRNRACILPQSSNLKL